jgi:hypothetical protein
MVLLSTQEEVQSCCQESAVERQMDRENLSTALGLMHLNMRTAAFSKRSSHPLFIRAVCILGNCAPANKGISTSFSNAGWDSFT